MDSIKSIIHSATFGKVFRDHGDDQQNCSSLLHLGKVADFYTIMRCRKMPPDAEVKYGTAGDAFVFVDGRDDALGSVRFWKFLLVTLKLLKEVTILGLFFIVAAVVMYFVVVHLKSYLEVYRKKGILKKRKMCYGSVNKDVRMCTECDDEVEAQLVEPPVEVIKTAPMEWYEEEMDGEEMDVGGMDGEDMPGGVGDGEKADAEVVNEGVRPLENPSQN